LAQLEAQQKGPMEVIQYLIVLQPLAAAAAELKQMQAEELEVRAVGLLLEAAQELQLLLLFKEKTEVLFLVAVTELLEVVAQVLRVQLIQEWEAAQEAQAYQYL
jgi:hypothetical protein